MASQVADLTTSPLHILWPHYVYDSAPSAPAHACDHQRYNIDTCREHDKGPDVFSSVLMELVDAGLEFCVSILGAHASDVPGTFIISSRFKAVS